MGVLGKYSSNHMHPHKYVWKNSKRATFEIWNLNVELVLDYIAPFTAVTKLKTFWHPMISDGHRKFDKIQHQELV